MTKKIITIIQLIIGFLVLIFSLIIFYKALIAIIPALYIIKFQSGLDVVGVDVWMKLILSIFLIQVVAVYTKKIFDKLSVSK